MSGGGITATNPHNEFWLEAHKKVRKSHKYNFQGCRILIPSRFNFDFIENELKNYEDKEVIELLKFGFPLAHDGKTGNRKIPNNHKGATLFPSQIESILEEEVLSGAAIGPFDHNVIPDACFSPLNSVPKKDSEKRRLILDMSYPPGNSINQGINKDEYLGVEEKLSLPSIDKLAERIRELGPNCKVFKIDLSRAYRQIYLDPKDIMWVAYFYKGRFYYDCSLSMGSRSSAKCCQRVSSAVVFIHTSHGYFARNYLDDLGGAEPADIAEEAFQHLRTALTRFGLIEAIGKTVAPSTIMVFLGIEVNTVKLTLKIPGEKWAEIQLTLIHWGRKSKATLKDTQKLAGLLNFACRCVKSGRIYLSRILNFLRSLPKFESRKIPASVREDITWWQEFAPLFNGISLIHQNYWTIPDQSISSDSCLEGGGGFCEGRYVHWKYPPSLINLKLNINQLECLMLVMVLKLWGKELATKKVLLFCDNQVSVLAINSNCSRDIVIQGCLREIHKLCGIFSFELKTVFLEGSKNRISDALSRWDKGTRFQQEFDKLTRKFKLKQYMVTEEMWSFVPKLVKN